MLWHDGIDAMRAPCVINIHRRLLLGRCSDLETTLSNEMKRREGPSERSQFESFALIQWIQPILESGLPVLDDPDAKLTSFDSAARMASSNWSLSDRIEQRFGIANCCGLYGRQSLRVLGRVFSVPRLLVPRVSYSTARF